MIKLAINLNKKSGWNFCFWICSNPAKPSGFFIFSKYPPRVDEHLCESRRAK